MLLLLCCCGAASAEPEDTVSMLASNAGVQAALEHIEADEARFHRELIELTEIPAPPFGEGQRAARFAELLIEAGLDSVSIDDAGNVVGRRAGKVGDRVVALTAHLDTVFPLETDVRVRVDGDTYYAPGVGDNSRGLVVLLGILRSLQHARIETNADILFIGNVGEEGLGDLRGMKHLFREGGPQIDCMIAIDGGARERIVYAGVGSHRYRVTFRGPGGHSWSAFGTANPHHALGRAIARFAARAPEAGTDGEKTSFNVGRIGGGTSINSIPFESWMEIDMRSASQAHLDAIDATLLESIQVALEEENAARLDGPELSVEVERVGKRPAARSDSNEPLIALASAAMRHFELEPAPKSSSTDANWPISLGIPAITLSRGGVSGNSHSPDEWWRNDRGYLSMQVALLTLLGETGLAESGD
jgi:tripeptide aminopeptidase